MRWLVTLFVLFFALTVKAQTKPYNSDSLFAAFTGGENQEQQKVKINHFLEFLPVRFYNVPPYAYTNAPVGTYYLTGGMYKLYFNDKHGIRLGYETNKEKYDFYDIGTATSTDRIYGSKTDRYLRYGYERVLVDGDHAQFYAVGDGIYVSSLANSTKVYHAETYSDQPHQPVKQLTNYDSTTQLTTKVSAGILQVGLGGRLFAGNWYLSAEMVWGITAYKKEEEYTSNAIFTRINLVQGYNSPSYNRTYDGDDVSMVKLAFSATYLRLGVGCKF